MFELPVIITVLLPSSPLIFLSLLSSVQQPRALYFTILPALRKRVNILVHSRFRFAKSSFLPISLNPLFADLTSVQTFECSADECQRRMTSVQAGIQEPNTFIHATHAGGTPTTLAVSRARHTPTLHAHRLLPYLLQNLTDVRKFSLSGGRTTRPLLVSEELVGS